MLTQSKKSKFIREHTGCQAQRYLSRKKEQLTTILHKSGIVAFDKPLYDIVKIQHIAVYIVHQSMQGAFNC